MMALSMGERAAASAKARAFRGRMLSPEEYMRLLECDTVGRIALYLSRTEAYGSYLEGSPRLEEMHRWQVEEIISLAPLLEEAPFRRYLGGVRSSLLLLWGERLDVEVVNRTLRMVTTGTSSREALRRWAEPAKMTLADKDRLLSAQSVRDVLDSVSGGPLERVLGEPLRRFPSSGGADGGALFRAKNAMDSFFLTRIMSGAGRLPVAERARVRRLFGVRADLVNIYSIYRARKFYRMSPEEALAITLPVRYMLKHGELSEFAFAADVRSMTALMSESRYGEAFRAEGTTGEMELEHNLYRFLWDAATAVFASGSMGVHVPLAYLTLRELEVKDLFTIIEGVRYHYDTGKLRGFLINPGARAADREGRMRWLS